MPALAKYPENTLLVMLGACGLVWICILALLFALFCVAGQRQGTGRGVAIFATALILIEHCITVTVWGIIAGFGLMPQFASFLLSAAMWVPVIMLCISLCSPAWRTTLLVAKQCRRTDDETAKNSGMCASLRSLCRASFHASLRRPVVFLFATIAALTATLAVNLALSGICYCSNPTSVTTWASRRSDPHYCKTGEFCHLYPVVGRDSQHMTLVAHMVAASTDSRPWGASASVCEVAVSNLTICFGSSWNVTSVLVDQAHIAEDLRYLAHTMLTNLTGERFYLVTVNFLDSANQVMGRKSIAFQALPSESSSTTVRMLAGGDIHQGDPFIQLLMTAMIREPNPHLFLLGGDLAYANSMRTCYLRWDQLLHDLSSIRTGVGASLALLTAVGNHEGGGYLVQKTRAEYYFYTQFFPQYDDDVPLDTTITYHTHRIGPLLGIIVLDSEVMVSVRDQNAYLTAALSSMVSPGSPSTSKFVMVVYHNPAFPGSRDLADGSTEAVRSNWVPIMDTYKVPLVLEFHDHAYKRTWPMFNLNVRAVDGTVHVGDGALGVYAPDREPDRSRAYLRKASGQNYIMVLKALPNGTMAVESLSTSGALVDSFSVDRRV